MDNENRKYRRLKDILIDILNGDEQDFCTEEEAEAIRRNYFSTDTNLFSQKGQDTEE